MGLPVPEGFVISTDCWREFEKSKALPERLRQELSTRIASMEQRAGRQFGDALDPLLVSVRSGAPVSMPGMMDTILNVGLTPENVASLSQLTGDPEFAYGSFARLLEGFARSVRNIDADLIEDAAIRLGPKPAPDERVDSLLALIAEESGPFPGPQGQLEESIRAVLESWDSRRAAAYRGRNGISRDIGTAVVVQRMVFGNLDDLSGSGVAFSRDPSTGENQPFGDFLFRAQGEDVVSGEAETLPLAMIGTRLPEVRDEVFSLLRLLERQGKDLCEVEFTVERGRLFLLQHRIGQRSPAATARVAVDLAREGVITRAEALARVGSERLTSAPAVSFVRSKDALDLARGLGASPGAAVGRVAFDSPTAERLRAEGHSVVLIRPTTSPADMPGLIASAALVTAIGGPASHAAVVARGMGLPAVCAIGRESLRIAEDRRSAVLNGHELHVGDIVSVDGTEGIVTAGSLPLSPGPQEPALEILLSWQAESELDGHRT